MVVLRGERVLLRPGHPEDAAKLVRIRNEPEVARRWGSADIEEEIGEELIGVDDGFVIEVNGEIVGAIQYHEENDHHRLTIDPAADNAAAIRAYEKAGFRRVGIMCKYERRGPDGAWHDGLLMDVL